MKKRLRIIPNRIALTANRIFPIKIVDKPYNIPIKAKLMKITEIISNLG